MPNKIKKTGELPFLKVGDIKVFKDYRKKGEKPRVKKCPIIAVNMPHSKAKSGAAAITGGRIATGANGFGIADCSKTQKTTKSTAANKKTMPTKRVAKTATKRSSGTCNLNPKTRKVYTIVERKKGPVKTEFKLVPNLLGVPKNLAKQVAAKYKKQGYDVRQFNDKCNEGKKVTYIRKK